MTTSIKVSHLGPNTHKIEVLTRTVGTDISTPHGILSEGEEVIVHLWHDGRYLEIKEVPNS